MTQFPMSKGTSTQYIYDATKTYLAIFQGLAEAQRLSLWKITSASVIIDYVPPGKSTITCFQWGHLPQSNVLMTLGI
jgi:hypothetical protein